MMQELSGAVEGQSSADVPRRTELLSFLESEKIWNSASKLPCQAVVKDRGQDEQEPVQVNKPGEDIKSRSWTTEDLASHSFGRRTWKDVNEISQADLSMGMVKRVQRGSKGTVTMIPSSSLMHKLKHVGRVKAVSKGLVCNVSGGVTPTVGMKRVREDGEAGSADSVCKVPRAGTVIAAEAARGTGCVTFKLGVSPVTKDKVVPKPVKNNNPLRPKQVHDFIHAMVVENEALKLGSERSAQALKDYETENTTRMAVESRAKTDAIDVAKRLSEEVKRRTTAENGEKLALEKCAVLEKENKSLEAQRIDYLSREADAALERCVTLKKRIADLEAEKTGVLSKSVVANEEII